MEDRITSLEKQVGDLREAKAKTEAMLENTNARLEELIVITGQLRDMLNKGKGAWLVIVVVAGTVGATISTVFKKVLGIA